jgi:ribosomal protein L37AE/L43A
MQASFDLHHYRRHPSLVFWTMKRELTMTSISSRHEQNCTRCGSKLVKAEWDERLNEQQVQYLWRCWNCQNEFVTVVASDEKPPSETEITKPFFTSLVIE